MRRSLVSAFVALMGWALPSILSYSTAYADLVWESKTLDYKATPVEKEARVFFVFTNEGANAVDLLNIQASCGCTVARSSKKVYQPGEKGTIDVVFTFGSREGHHEKTIIVETGDPSQKSVLLLRVDIPSVIEINKRRLTWEIGDPLEEQIFELIDTTGKSSEPKLVGGDGFETHLEKATPGIYRLTVKPLSTECPQHAFLRLWFGERSVILSAHVQ